MPNRCSYTSLHIQLNDVSREESGNETIVSDSTAFHYLFLALRNSKTTPVWRLSIHHDHV